MITTHRAYYRSDLGLIEVTGTPEGIVSVSFSDDGPATGRETPACLAACLQQLDEYFRGRRTEFSVPLLLQGTDFQRKTWGQVARIPFGQTRSYAEIAASLGNEKAVRAVGNANGKNKVAIIIPCHRVVGSNGNLTGYGGGLWRKAWLLDHERAVAPMLPKAG